MTDTPLTAADFPRFHYTGEFVRAVDGDTAEVVIQLGFGITNTIRLRVEGYNAAELVGPFREQAIKAQAELDELLRDRPLFIQTIKDRTSYNRYRANVWVQLLPGAPLVSVAAVMEPHDMSHVNPP